MNHHTLIPVYSFCIIDFNHHKKFQVATIVGTLISTSYKNLNSNRIMYIHTDIHNNIHTRAREIVGFAGSGPIFES